uniref:Pentraxin family member n=1 Tax=Neogobius melanostomus TaxID=47308 RepID=A0A8C6SAF6_9GOBI
MKFFVCLMMLVSTAAGVIMDLSGQMFTFPQETNTAHVKLIPELVNFPAVTVCHRSFTDLKRDHSLFSLSSTNDHNHFLVFMNWAKQEIQSHVHSLFVGYGGLDYAPNKWHSICTTWNSSLGLVQMWFNGQPLVRKYIATTFPLTTNPIIIVGQEQDSHGGGFDAKQSFVGMMCDVHMWNYVISPCEIQKYMKEKNFTPGNVLNWAALNHQKTEKVLTENKQIGCHDLHEEGCRNNIFAQHFASAPLF